LQKIYACASARSNAFLERTKAEKKNKRKRKKKDTATCDKNESFKTTRLTIDTQTKNTSIKCLVNVPSALTGKKKGRIKQNDYENHENIVVTQFTLNILISELDITDA
jgi:short-subunit dehydrogenase